MGKIDAAGKRLVRGLREPINPYATVIVSLYTFMWGLWLFTPAWVTFEKASRYSAMAGAGPEWLWGLVAMLSGIGMIYGVLKPSFRSLSGAAFTGALHWGIISMFYFLGEWQDTGGLTAGMICIYCAFVYLNLRLNRHTVDYNR